jgi:hypothetical protein
MFSTSWQGLRAGLVWTSNFLQLGEATPAATAAGPKGPALANSAPTCHVMAMCHLMCCAVLCHVLGSGHVAVERYLESEGLPFTVFQPLYIYGAHTAKDCEQWFIDRIIR